MGRHTRRTFGRLTLLLAFVLTPLHAVASDAADVGDRVLYNGIRLPEQWPPRVQRLTREPMDVPYLAQPPEVVPIDVGRQLFVDDFLIESTTLKRTFHSAEYQPANPLLVPGRAWEKTGNDPSAMVFSDGVWYDPSSGVYKPVEGSPLRNADKRSFIPPGNNADGDGDWVLVVEADPRRG